MPEKPWNYTRRSPAESATLYKVGYIGVGNDGNYYIVKSFKGKYGTSKRWVFYEKGYVSPSNTIKKSRKVKKSVKRSRKVKKSVKKSRKF